MSKPLAFIKQHWKELGAVALAAIPVLFLLFHKGTQQAASKAITYIPATFGGATAADASTASPPPLDVPGAAARQAAALGRTPPSPPNQSPFSSGPFATSPNDRGANQSTSGLSQSRSQGVNQLSSWFRGIIGGGFPPGGAPPEGTFGPGGGLRTSVGGNTGTAVQPPRLKRALPR